ncbi:MAG: efflux RND transporter permease subunit [Acidobacteria bacterium]|nr:efflux RND transporter permease subunit [Acidobacteriota bacterium]
MQKLAEICVRRPVFATMLILSLVVLGLTSLRDLGVDNFPKVEFPSVVVVVTMEGASPEEIETEITKPVEEALNTISGLDELRSTSSEGLSVTIATFILERDVDSAAQDVRDKMSRTMNQLPAGVDPPVIEKADPDATPIVILAVSGARSLREITEIARKRLKEPLESLPGIGSVELVGGRTREIQVYVDPEKLRGYGLTLDQVRNALRAQNIEAPGGRLDLRNSELVLRTMGRVVRVEDFKRIIVAHQNGSNITVGDIGKVEDGILEPRSLSRLNGTNAVSLYVRKQSGTNTVEIAELAQRKIEELSRTLPPGVESRVIRDQSLFIRNSVDELIFHMTLGAFLASLAVLLFLQNLRSAVIAAVSIPTSLIATFTLMRALDFTLNNMTLLGLTLAVGIVIDDAIVVLENIFRHIEEGREPPKKAAISATREIGLAVMATTLSLVVIFLPTAFMSGMVGRFFSSYGLTMACAIMVSLLVAFTLTPTMCSIMFRRSDEPSTGTAEHASKDSLIYRVLDRSYDVALAWSMRHRAVVVMISIGVVLSSIPLVYLVGVDVIPFDDTSDYEIAIKLPPGVNLVEADRRVLDIEQRLSRLRGVQDVFVTVGDPSGNAVNSANIYIRIPDVSERDYSLYAAMREAREVLKAYPDLRSSVQQTGAIAIRGNVWNVPVNFHIRGADLEKLEEISSFITGEMRKTRGFADVDTSLEAGKPEVRVNIDREKAASLGVQVDDIARSLRTYIAGERVGKFKELDEQYDVRLRVEDAFRQDPSRLSQLMIPAQGIGHVELSSLASFSRETGPVQIDRLNRQRNVNILANLTIDKPLGEAMQEVQQVIRRANLPPGYEAMVTGRAELLDEAISNFFVAFLLSFIFMYMVLASQFNSFLHPITIMLSLPLAVPFALLSLVVTSETLNIYSALGLMVLFGIVKKNAILQVDYANALRDQGLPVNEAIVKACHTRLRPILMTTAAFVAGMIPIALGTGAGSSSRRSIAIVAIGGQLLCLLITLLLTPVAYSLFEGLKRRFAEWRQRILEPRARLSLGGHSD